MKLHIFQSARARARETIAAGRTVHRRRELYELCNHTGLGETDALEARFAEMTANDAPELLAAALAMIVRQRSRPVDEGLVGDLRK